MSSSSPLAEVWPRLDALIDWERAQRARRRTDLSAELDLLQRLGDPHRACRVVHVTGTKGKGSVCALIEAGLRAAGWRTGRYASPHLESVTERIVVDGQPIAEDAMAAVLAQALAARDAAVAEATPGAAAVWFDVVTAAAFRHFADQRLDWVVVEVGIGGRLDSTNVVEPELSIVTNVGLEHVDVLGPTREAIATEKAGIVKPGRPVLTALAPDDPAGRVVRGIASQRGSALTWCDLRAAGGVEGANRKLAREALGLLGLAGVASLTRGAALSAADLSDATAAAAGLPGRLERFDLPWPGNPDGPAGILAGAVAGAAPVASTAPAVAPPALRVVLDGAHVPFALTDVLHQLRAEPAQAGPAVVLLAIGGDKDAAGLIDALRGHAAAVVCTELAHGRRAWGAAELAQKCAQAGLATQTAATPLDGWRLALARVRPGQWLLVTGSLYLVGELRAKVRRLALPAA